MKSRPYPKYKPTGVEWLGEVPEHWKTSRLSFLFVHANAGEVIDKSYWGEGNALLYTCAREPLLSDYATFPAEKRTTERDLLLTRNGTPYVHKPPTGAIYSNVVQRVTLRSGLDRDYLSYSLGDACLGLKGYGVSIESLNFEIWKSLRVAIPFEDEQRAIASFLDRETARINVLIEKKQRQIELLQEKRAALISHAVTKGLNPNARMKDSGIEWLGEVPAHWDLRKLGYMANMLGGCTPSKDNEEYWAGSIPWVSPKDMKRRDIGDSEDHVSQNAVLESSLRLIEPPVVLIVVRGMILAHTFPVAMTSAPVTINQDMKALKPKAGLDPDYLAFLLEGISQLILSHVEDSAHGTKCLRTDQWKSCAIYVPEEPEQKAICTRIHEENQKITRLSEHVAASVDKLREYRAALISAAVTGKIDVSRDGQQ